ncbi:MAG TPA: VCBS repeat-containing protein, partial [Planctomycetota bacterium]|nr:VCBS repeat-containing protein [Planctomycetota bacterium]
MTPRSLSVRFLLPLVFAPAIAPAVSAQLFPAKQFDVGTLANRIVAADLNGDGRLDVVCQGIAGITVMLGSGDGEFVVTGGAVPVPGGIGQAIEIGEFNGDHHLDLVVTGFAAGGTFVATLLGDGAGGFAAGPVLSLPIQAYTAKAADLDGDAKTDLVLLAPGYDTAGGALVTLFNDGAGAFTLGARYPAGTLTNDFELGDLDGDGAVDAVVTDYEGVGVSVLLGDGAGGFGAAVAYPAADESAVIALSDLNGDGHLDAVVGGIEAGPNPIAVLHGDGAGGFAPPILVATASKHAALELADVNGDGAIDLFTAYPGQGVKRLLGDGAGSFGPPETLPVDPNTVFLLLRDATGDGALDLLLVLFGADSESFSLVRGDGHGGFESYVEFAGPAGAMSVAPADLDGDGTADLVLSGGGLAISVALGTGDGGFAPVAVTPVGGTTQELALGDWNGDGRPDAAFATTLPAAVGIALGNGTATFSAPVLKALSVPTAHVAVGDLNADGNLDVVTHQAAALVTLLGDGAGGLSAPISTVMSPPFDIALADFDEDGRLDAVANVTINFQTAFVALAAGDGAGGFASPTLITVPGCLPSEVALGDLNGDAHTDVVVRGVPASPISGTPNVRIVAALLGNGAGTLVPGPALPMATYASHLLVFDADLDGHLDVATVGVRLTLRRGDGTGALGSDEHFMQGALAQAAAAVDLDGDGDLDVVTASSSTPALSVLRNRSKAPAGVSAFGSGTPGCSGMHGITAVSSPTIGNAAFAVAVSNAPSSGTGLALVSSADDATGSDPLGIGLTLHVDLAANVLLGFDAATDGAGSGRVALPIPAMPGLAGATVYAQVVWGWGATAP